MFSLGEYNYDLPPELIAQQPAMERDRSNLLVLERHTGRISHHVFSQIDRFLTSNDVLVINDTEVIPARLHGRKNTGGKAEILISDFAGGCKVDAEPGTFICECLVKSAKRPKPGTRLYFDQGLKAEIMDSRNGTCIIKFHTRDDVEDVLYRIGEVPIPPYIKRGAEKNHSCDDRTSYQTVYAAVRGAVAAPTAGLHFTEKLLKKIESRGIPIVPITLHIGYGTFSPVRGPDIRTHKMHSERYSISQASADLINAARAAGKRIVAVGTTCIRTLEFASSDDGVLFQGSGCCDLFIYPGYRFKVVEALITNFHLPKSTLLMLVSAFAGREKILDAYKEAIKRGYRFYSYGDAMFIF